MKDTFKSHTWKSVELYDLKKGDVNNVNAHVKPMFYFYTP